MDKNGFDFVSNGSFQKKFIFFWVVKRDRVRKLVLSAGAQLERILTFHVGSEMA